MLKYDTTNRSIKVYSEDNSKKGLYSLTLKSFTNGLTTNFTLITITLIPNPLLEITENVEDSSSQTD